MPQFTISRHEGAKGGDHFDLFLENGDHLLTWRIQSTNFYRMQSGEKIKNHDPKYLGFEGEIAGGKGRVKIWDRGEYVLDAQSAIHYRLALHGSKVKVRLCLDRRGDDSSEKSEWLMYDASEKLRRLVMQHFRRATVPDSESEELMALREKLIAWEKRLAAAADRFVNGRKVEWEAITQDTGLPRKIRELRARWIHPWLVHAYRFAMRLDRWTRQMRAYHTS